MTEQSPVERIKRASRLLRGTLEESLADPQVRHRGMTLGAGPTLAPGPPLKLSDTPPSVRTPPPLFGADTDEVLAGLGFDAAQISRLRADGIV